MPIADALFDRQRDDARASSRRRAANSGARAASHVGHDADADDAQRDEQQHPGERRVRHMRKQTAAEQRKRRARAPRQTSAPSWEAPPVSADDRRARRARVDRKGAEKAGQQIGRADADEVAVDVGAAGGIVDEARVVAAVCTIATAATMSASPAVWRNVS